jgi:hypothetical protein
VVLVTRGDRDRGQLVLVAAGVLAIALVPIVLAYLQFGYHADVRASVEYDDPERNAERVLERSVFEAVTGVRGEYDWWQRTGAARTVRDELRPRLETLRSARVEAGTAYEVSYNRTAAEAWATANCPSGPNRDFGPCEAEGGVVVQERAGESVVLAVAFDVRVTTERGWSRSTLVVQAASNAY